MADIKLEDLCAPNIMGDELFNDSESYMTEINDECQSILGGLPGVPTTPLICGTRHTCKATDIACGRGTAVNDIN
jgi:hypothetical protein